MKTVDTTVKKFQEKLKELLLPEGFDSDVGFYRFLNYKRKQIEKFINEDLASKIETVFEGHKEEGSQVLNDLYSFFSKYFKDGELIPHCCCSANENEAKLCWANCGQYYVGEFIVEKQTKRSVVKRVKEYFIHKNLKRFLSEQLDYFIKTEVLDIKDIESGITRAKLVKELGEAIIDFLAQIEDFQKELWERKKRAIETEYVITLDKIKEYAGEDFLESIIDEILSNEKQLKEWKELGFGEIKGKEDLVMEHTLYGVEWKRLPIDTKYFSREFKEKLLGKIAEKHNIEDILDGLLIKSENWQALNFLLERYKGKVQTIYIDPPFNKGQDENYLYSVRYKDSAWITLLENRLRLAKELLNERGSIFVRCDYRGNMYVRLLMNEIFGKENFRNEIVVKRGVPKAGLISQFKGFRAMTTAYDNLYWYSKNKETRFSGFYKEAPEEKRKSGFWADFQKGEAYDRPTMRYEILGINIDKGQWKWSKQRAYKAVENYIKYLEISKETGESLEEYWLRTGKQLEFIKREGNKIKYWVHPREELLIDNNWLDIAGYSSTTGFRTENSEILLKRIIQSTSNEGDLVMDFFLGSGTTTAVAHKLRRRWIGVEIGEHFWTIVMPRMKRVLFYDKSGISKEKDVKEKYNEKTAGGFFKYQVLEDFLSMEW